MKFRFTFNLQANSLRTGILNTKYDKNQQDESVHASLKELRRGLRDLNKISKRLESLADKIPPLSNEHARTMMYQAQNELSHAFQILSRGLKIKTKITKHLIFKIKYENQMVKATLIKSRYKFPRYSLLI